MTRAELFEAAAKMMRMCDEAGIEHTYKFMRNLCSGNDHAFSEIHADNYEFPLAIVEGRPVFKGDVLFDRNGEKYIASINCFNHYPEPGIFVCFCLSLAKDLSWNPPRKTFTLNGEELPLPYTGTPGGFRISNNANLLGKYWWSRCEDRNRVEAALIKLLENK